MLLCNFAVPDGVKGKTWGPSTLHQRERGHLTALRPVHHHPHFSKSAPNLPPAQPPSLAPIGNPYPDQHNVSIISNDSAVSNLSYNTSALSSLQDSRLVVTRYPPIRDHSIPAPAYSQHAHAHSRSINDLTTNHYDTVFSTDSFVIAKQSGESAYDDGVSKRKASLEGKKPRIMKSIQSLLDDIRSAVKSVSSVSVNQEKCGLISDNN